MRVVILVPILMVWVSSSVADPYEDHKRILGESAPAIVRIYNFQDGTEKSIGTGFLIDQKGRLVTNFHVIRGATKLGILFDNGTEIHDESITVLNVDAKKDLALLQVNHEYVRKRSNVKPLKLATGGVDQGDFFLIISNPKGEARNTVSDPKTVGAIRSIDDFIRRRKELALEDPAYSYPVIQFDNVVKGGSSGAPLIEYENQTVIGVATGATGKDEFAGFAVPAKFVRDLVNRSGQRPPRQIARYFEEENINISGDPYYPWVQFYSGLATDDQIRVQGTVYNSVGHVLDDVQVVISDTEMPTLEYATRTDEKGNYSLSIPQSELSKWRLSLSRRNYERLTLEPRTIMSTPDYAYHELSVAQALRKSVVWFYADPYSINIESDPEEFHLVGEETRGDFISRKELRWKVCASEADCEEEAGLPDWLEVSPLEGATSRDETGERLGIGAVSVAVRDGAGSVSPRPVMFQAKVGEEEEYAVVYVGQRMPDVASVHGMVYLADGGVPDTSGLRVSAYNADGRQIGSTSQVRDGYFRIPIPKTGLTAPEAGANAKIEFRIESNRFRLAAPEAAFMNFPADTRKYIEVVPK